MGLSRARQWLVVAVYLAVAGSAAVWLGQAFHQWWEAARVQALEEERAKEEKRRLAAPRPWPNPHWHPDAFMEGDMGPRHWKIPVVYDGRWYGHGLLHLTLTWPGLYPPVSPEGRSARGIGRFIDLFIKPPRPHDPMQLQQPSLLERAEQDVADGRLLPAKRLPNGLLEYANPKSGDGQYYIPYEPEIYTETGLRWGISCHASNKPEPDPKNIECGAGETYVDGVHVGYQFQKSILDDWQSIYHDINKLIKSFERE